MWWSISPDCQLALYIAEYKLVAGKLSSLSARLVYRGNTCIVVYCCCCCYFSMFCISHIATLATAAATATTHYSKKELAWLSWDYLIKKASRQPVLGIKELEGTLAVCYS